MGGMSRPQTVSPATKAKCRELVRQAAVKHQIPPAMIVAHCRFRRADLARREVMRRMHQELGLCRRVIAEAFGRDLRRVRASELAKPCDPLPPTGTKARSLFAEQLAGFLIS
jgi:hypothetical protein